MKKALKSAELIFVRKQFTDVKPHPRNPRVHSPEQINKLRHLIKTHGFAKGSIVYQKSSGYLLAGHGIVEALKAEGYTSADMVELDVPEGKAEAFMIADNKVGDDSLFDNIGLQQLINELSEQNIPSLDFGFDSDDLEKLASDILADSGGYQAEPQDDEIPDVVEPITQSGDLWTLGKNRVLCGDSTKAEDVERLMGGVKADVGITDAPYGIRDEEWDDRDNFLNSLPVWFGLYKQYAGYGLLWFCADNMLANVTANGNCVRLLIWNKPAGSQFSGASNNNLWYSSEAILVFDFNGITKNCGTEEYSYSVFDNRTIPGAKEGHPTTKPIDLMCWLINHYTKANQTILDLFLGSGSTLIACQKLNRVCYGMEIDQHYCDVIIKRYIDFVGSSEGVFVERDGVKIGYADLNR